MYSAHIVVENGNLLLQPDHFYSLTLIPLQRPLPVGKIRFILCEGGCATIKEFTGVDRTPFYTPTQKN